MSLPKINAPEYTLVIPSTDEEVKFRPFLVKEEKVLLIAQETGGEQSLYHAIKNLVETCCFGKVDVDALPLFDIEYIFIQIRAKSVDEIAEVMVICPDDGETEIKIKVDLTKLNIEMDEKHDARIQLTENIGILMSYPTMDLVEQYAVTGTPEPTEQLFKMIAECIYQIWEGEEVHDAMDYTMKDKLAFIDSLNHDQFEKIQNFFETMPTLKHEIEVTNPKTKKKSTVTLSGMNDFF